MISRRTIASAAAACWLVSGACGGSGGAPPNATGTAGSGGVGPSGAAGNAQAGAAGASSDAGTGAAGSGTPATDAGAERADSRADAGAADASSGAFGGVAGLEDLSAVKASSGCGKDPGQPLGSWQMPPAGANKYMFGFPLSTMTEKGSFTRRYFVQLPKTYDKSKPYRVVFEAPRCGGVGYEVPAFDAVAAGTNAPGDPHGDGVIQVGLTPDPTAWMAGCFDTSAGASTIEKAFIETLWPLVASSFCVDEHRVFLAGFDSGAWLANQLGHVYGSRLFRAIATSGGGLVGESTRQPCLAAGLPGSATTVGGCLPVPGMWWHDMADSVDAYDGTRQAVEAALVANRCANAAFTAGPKTPHATLPHATCVSYSTCPAAFPVVLCTASQQDHKNLLDEPANLAATWAFFRGF